MCGAPWGEFQQEKKQPALTTTVPAHGGLDEGRSKAAAALRRALRKPLMWVGAAAAVTLRAAAAAAADGKAQRTTPRYFTAVHGLGAAGGEGRAGGGGPRT